MGSIPKHRKITEELLKRVSKAESGERLSTIRSLMVEFDASQASIVRSLDELASRGLIRRRRGSGIYVAGTNHQSRVFGVYLDGDLANHSNALFLEGVHLAARRHGFHVADFGPITPFKSQEEVISAVVGMGFAGLICSLSTANYFHLACPEWLEMLRKMPAPIVSCRPIPNIRADVVIPDFFSVFENLGRHLRSQGLKKIRFVGSISISTLARLQGLRVGLGEDFELEMEMRDGTSKETYERVRRMVEDGWEGNLVIGVPPPRTTSLDFLKNGFWFPGSPYSLSVVLENADEVPPGVACNVVAKTSSEYGAAVADRLISRIRGDRSEPRYEIFKNELKLVGSPPDQARAGSGTLT
jgi:hypothetical protein